MANRAVDQACYDLFQVLRAVNVSSVIGHKKNILSVFVGDLDADRPLVPAEFQGFKTRVLQDPKPCAFRHEKVSAGDNKGCVHTQWEMKQFLAKGIVPNSDCRLTQRTYTPKVAQPKPP